MESTLFYLTAILFAATCFFASKFFSKKYVVGEISYKSQEYRKNFEGRSIQVFFLYCVVYNETRDWSKDVKIRVPKEMHDKFKVGDKIPVKA